MPPRPARPGSCRLKPLQVCGSESLSSDFASFRCASGSAAVQMRLQVDPPEPVCVVLPARCAQPGVVGWLVQVGDLEFLAEADDHSQQQRRASAAPPSPSAAAAAGAKAATAADKEVSGADSGASRSRAPAEPEQAQAQAQALSLLALRPDVKSIEAERLVRMHAFPPCSLTHRLCACRQAADRASLLQFLSSSEVRDSARPCSSAALKPSVVCGVVHAVHQDAGRFVQGTGRTRSARSVTSLSLLLRLSVA